MRIWRHLKISVPLLLAITAIAETSAQEFGGHPSYGAPAFMAGQGYPGGPQQGMPQSFQSHPMISPFDNAFEQHFNTDGLWFRRAIGAMSPMNDYYFNVDYVNIRSRGLKGNIGDDSAPTYVLDEGLRNDTANGTTTDADLGLADSLLLPPFPFHDAKVNGDNKMNGLRLSGGVNNKAGWGLQWNVTYGAETSKVFDARRNLFKQRLHGAEARFLSETEGRVSTVPSNLRTLDERQILEEQILNRRVFDSGNVDEFGLLGLTEDILDRSLYPYGGLGLQNGDDIDGFAQFFDLGFSIEQKVEYFNAGFHFSSSAMYESDSVRIRPIIGGRHTRLTEGFYFQGQDSGLSYTFSIPDGLDDDDDFVIDNVLENGSLGATDPLTTTDRQIMVNSFVTNVVRSQMSGPEAGIEYDITKYGNLNLTGSTRAGVLFNVEELDLSGDNIGNTFEVGVDPNTGDITRTDMFDTSTDQTNRTENFFSDSGKSTHLSPMFEQSLNASIPLFARIPVLRDIWQLEEAKLRLGWTYTWIGEVADPSQSIVWNAKPTAGVTPTLKVRRSSYFQNQFNVGINWEF